MKKSLTLLILLMTATIVYAQENMITISGGYPFAHVEEVDESATGFRITGLYEFNPGNGNWAHGLSVGYVSVSGEAKESFYTTTYDINSWPIYYAPKFMFGNDKLKGFIKGALGWQFSKLKVEGDGQIGGSLEDNDGGFTGGGGAGALYSVNEKIFLNLEYELLWMSNSFYRDETLNTVSLGIGFRF